MAKAIRIAMLSGPRNLSTTIMRAFENRSDTVVSDEPFYACYLKASGANHPMRDKVLASLSTDWKTVASRLEKAGKNAAYSFEKHIAFHFAYAPDFHWLDNARVFHLIRDPRAMIASYDNKYDDVAPILDSYRIQRQLYQSAPSPVVDAADILKSPQKILNVLCKALDIPFSGAMLNWPAGPRDSDGVWAPHWYDAVQASTGFRAYEEKELKLSPELENLAQNCMADYAFFYERRLTA